jgi:DNA anti-recombination protein RmuC
MFEQIHQTYEEAFNITNIQSQHLGKVYQEVGKLLGEANGLRNEVSTLKEKLAQVNSSYSSYWNWADQKILSLEKQIIRLQTIIAAQEIKKKQS